MAVEVGIAQGPTKYLPVAAGSPGRLAALSARLTGDVTAYRAETIPEGLDPDTAGKRLAEVLAEARLAAGRPTLAKLGRQIGYHESMLSRVMKGRVTPAHDKLVLLAEQLEVSNSTFQTVWLPLWKAARRKPELPTETATEDPTRPSGAPAGFTCPACGAWVADGRRHIEWHMAVQDFPRLATVTPLRPVP